MCACLCNPRCVCCRCVCVCRHCADTAIKQRLNQTSPAALNRCFSLNSNNSSLKDEMSLNKSAWRLKGEQFEPAAVPLSKLTRFWCFCHRLVCLSPDADAKHSQLSDIHPICAFLTAMSCPCFSGSLSPADRVLTWGSAGRRWWMITSDVQTSLYKVFTSFKHINIIKHFIRN